MPEEDGNGIAQEMLPELDRSRSFGTIWPGPLPSGAKYEQDWHYFDTQGVNLGENPAAPPLELRQRNAEEYTKHLERELKRTQEQLAAASVQTVGKPTPPDPSDDRGGFPETRIDVKTMSWQELQAYVSALPGVKPEHYRSRQSCLQFLKDSEMID
jgi:hypothetical protein